MLPLFVDLDGVLADFDAGVRLLTGRTPDEYTKRHGTPALWSLLARTPDFYTLLPPHPDGPHIWARVKRLQPTILTGCPLGEWAAPQKRAWVAKFLGSHVPVITCLSKNKHTYATSGAILIDDRVATGVAWSEAGGTFVHHTTLSSTLAQLDTLLS